MTDKSYQDIIKSMHDNKSKRRKDFINAARELLQDPQVQPGYPMWNNKTQKIEQIKGVMDGNR